MARLLQREQITLAIDATHPYAAEASANARAACQAANVPYWRLRRPEGGSVPGAYYAADLADAVRFLSTTTGPILAAIGAKGLAQLQALPDYQKRLYVRVLPMVQSLKLCQELGLAGKHILAMQGPFSAAFNQALLQEVGAQWLLTKESGDSGGFAQKVQAAQALGVGLVIIRRPADEAGYTLAEIKAMLTERGKGEGIRPSSI